MQTIQWLPFSEKHIAYMRKAMKCRMSVAEGAVRSSKTITHCLIMGARLETTKDKIHLATGSSLPNAKLNIGDCNGFGLEHIFRGRCRWGKYKDNEALFIQTKTGEKIVIFAGGGKADSYKKILGNSYGIWIATEINEHYDSEDSKTSFIKVAMGRQIASAEPCILWDLNPSNPNHKIYKDYIDKYKEIDFVGGYNYEHFTIEDNKAITEQRKEEIRSQYDPNSVWYKRDILGMRCIAEGLIYKDFADNTEKYMISEEDYIMRYRNQITHINIGVDFGGNKSAHTFCCVGFTYGLKQVIILEAERHECDKNNITPTKLEELFVNFVNKCYNRYGKVPNVYADSAEQTLINGLRSVGVRQCVRPVNVYNAKKKETKDRIALVNKLMATGKFKLLPNCEPTVKALQQAVFNNKPGHEDERLDDFTSDIDSLDAMEYAIEPHLQELSRL